MVSAKSMIVAAVLATAVVAAPAPTPDAAPAPVVLNARASEELVARTIELYASQALQERGIVDLVGSLTSIIGVVLNLLAGTINSIIKPDSASTAEVLAKTFTDLTTNLTTVVDALKDLPLVGPIISLLAPIILSPLVLNLTTLLEKIVVLLVDDVDKAILSPALATLPPLLGTVDQILKSLLGGVPLLGAQVTPALGLVDKVQGILGGL